MDVFRRPRGRFFRLFLIGTRDGGRGRSLLLPFHGEEVGLFGFLRPGGRRRGLGWLVSFLLLHPFLLRFRHRYLFRLGHRLRLRLRLRLGRLPGARRLFSRCLGLRCGRPLLFGLAYDGDHRPHLDQVPRLRL